MPDPISILLVDDHADTNRSLMLLLTRRGYRVQSAVNIAEAMQRAGEEAFDVLLSDMSLPDGSGLDLLARLHAHPATLRRHHHQRVRHGRRCGAQPRRGL